MSAQRVSERSSSNAKGRYARHEVLSPSHLFFVHQTLLPLFRLVDLIYVALLAFTLLESCLISSEILILSTQTLANTFCFYSRLGALSVSISSTASSYYTLGV